jgi:hypothetical protein
MIQHLTEKGSVFQHQGGSHIAQKLRHVPCCCDVAYLALLVVFQQLLGARAPWVLAVVLSAVEDM